MIENDSLLRREELDAVIRGMFGVSLPGDLNLLANALHQCRRAAAAALADLNRACLEDDRIDHNGRIGVALLRLERAADPGAPPVVCACGTDPTGLCGLCGEPVCADCSVEQGMIVGEPLVYCDSCAFAAGESEQAAAAAAEPVRRCRVCGCTDDYAPQCIAKTGAPCWWVGADLCSACEAPG